MGSRRPSRIALASLFALAFAGTAAHCGEDPEPVEPPFCEDQLAESSTCRNFESMPADSCPGENDLVVLCWDATNPPCDACVQLDVTTPNPDEHVFCCPAQAGGGNCPQC